MVMEQVGKEWLDGLFPYDIIGEGPKIVNPAFRLGAPTKWVSLGQKATSSEARQKEQSICIRH